MPKVECSYGSHMPGAWQLGQRTCSDECCLHKIQGMHRQAACKRDAKICAAPLQEKLG